MSTRIKILVPAVLLLSVAIPAHAIERVASRFGALEIRFGYAMPLGEYDGLPGLDFIFEDSASGAELVDFDAERVFDDGFAFGFSYGQILAGRWRASIGFDYARHDVKNPIIQQIGDYQYSIAFPDDVSYNQYGLSFRVAYAPTDLHRQGWSPFVGVGALSGLSAISSPGYETDSEFDFGMSLDFGLDVKLWENPDARSFVALSSINSWSFVATGERVSHLQIGGGLKYFFKP
jgi:hypothetical protein